MNAQLTPSIPRDKFARIAENGRIPTLSVEIPFNEPHLIYEQFMGPGAILLESVKGPQKIARHSFACIQPYAEYRIKDGKETLAAEGMPHKTEPSGNPLKTIRDLLGSYSQAPDPTLPPFQGGAAGLFCYDFIKYLERVPQTTEDDLDIPDANMYLYDRLFAFDHMNHKAWVIVAPGARRPIKDSEWETAYDEAVHTLRNLARSATAINKMPPDTSSTGQPEADQSEAGQPGADQPTSGYGQLTIDHHMNAHGYTSMVERVKQYIAAGDIFQANISLRVSADIKDTRPWDLYLTLREINPSPFAGYLDFGDYIIASSSPERLVRVSQDIIDTRPIAGTRPRGQSTDEDDLMRKELLLNEKERAEHIMLIDLERNDIGRVCEYGSVRVDELMTTEDYSHVMHIVSNVTGKLARGKDMLDAISATFPGGTITGVPKVRCMEIIDELEKHRRGPYTGSFGYMGYNGNMDMNIVIRTFTIKNARAYVQAGAGIVADSDPEREYKESLKKAEALIRTLERTV